jgi:hypothetical protein
MVRIGKMYVVVRGIVKRGGCNALDEKLRENEESLLFCALVLAFVSAALAEPPGELRGHLHLVMLQCTREQVRA